MAESSVEMESAADVDDGAAGGVWFGAAEDFPGHGGGVAFAEDDVAEQVPERVAFGPGEVAVWSLSRRVAEMEEKRRDGVGDGGRLGAKYLVPTDFDTLDSHHVHELRGFAHLHFEKDDGRTRRDVVRLAGLLRFAGVLLHVARLPLVCNDIDLPSGFLPKH